MEMGNALQVKMDVINELRNQIYYGQLEVQRLINAPVGLSHKELIDRITFQLKENVLSNEAINLIESYIPTQQPQVSAPTKQTPVNEEELVGIKKIN